MEAKGLIQELMNQETSFDILEIIEKLFSTTENVDKESWKESQRAEVEESAVSLWNWTVARKIGPLITDTEKVKLRHVACKLMMLCDVNDPREEVMRRQILMVMKTGKGWVDVGKPALGNEFLETALNILEKLYAHLAKSCSSEAEANIHKADIEKDVFKVLSYQAESANALADFEKAVVCVQRCKDILIRLPKEACYLSLLCYNFGVETYELKRYEQSSFWLSLSYEIGKMHKKYSTSKEMKAKVLRLLATVYLEWDYRQYQDKAFQVIIMANEENLHPAGFYLKIKILLKGDASSDEDISKAISELLYHEVTLEICLDTVKLLLEHGREAVGFDFLESVAQLFEKSPDAGKVLLLQIKLLLQRKKEPLAKQKIEGLIAAQSIGKQLSHEIVNQLHLVLWESAAKNYELKSYSEALQWYNYSLSFYTSGQSDHQNLAKLHRNMAACYLHLKEPDKAKEAVKEAERHDPNSIFTQFFVYKVAILEKNAPTALNAFVAMEESATELTEDKGNLLKEGSVVTNLLNLAAQFALENDQHIVAIEALGYLSHHLQDCQQALTAIKCLIRLVLSKEKSEEDSIKDMETLLLYLTAAHHRLDGLLKEKNEMLDIRVSEAQWFRKIAWNLAVQCESCLKVMRDFFIISFKFSQLCPLDKATLLAQRTCLLMAAAVDLDISRNNVLPFDEAELLTQALGHIQSCREIWKVLKQTGDFPKDPTDTILLLYEFEASAKLNIPGLSSLVDQALDLPQVEIKTLETMAALAMESPAHYPAVCKKALKTILMILRKRESMDTIAYSKSLHSLVHLSLPSGMIEADVCALEEAWAYFEDARSLLDSTGLQTSYPELEIIWLMTRAWNTGICQYCAGKYKEAEQWCGLGMRFLTYLGTLKHSYENQMTTLYSEVLDKLDRAKRLQPKEE